MTFRFPLPLAQAIEAQARATGRDRTTVVAEALSQVLGLSLPAKATVTIEMLQRQIEQAESSITSLAEQLAALQNARIDSTIPFRLKQVEQVEQVEQVGNVVRTLPSTMLAKPQTDSTLPVNGGATHRAQAVSTSPQEQPERLHFTAPLDPPNGLPERILATMIDPIFVCDRAQRLRYINPLGARSLGLEAYTPLQQTVQASTLPPVLKAQLSTQLEVVFTSGRSLTSEISLTTPLYGLRDYAYTLSPIQGSIEHIEAVLFSTQDITDRKHIQALLEASEVNYQNLFEFTNDSILILDALTWRILSANTNAFQRLGYTRQELMQLGMEAILPEWRTSIVSELSQRLQTHGTSVFVLSLRHKDGTLIPVEIHSRLIEYGDRLAVQSFIRDRSQYMRPEGDRSE